NKRTGVFSLDGYLVYLYAGNLYAQLVTGNGFLTAQPAGSISDGQWHYIAFTADSANGKIYVDGTLRTTMFWNGFASPATTTDPLVLGAEGGYPFTGQFDEFSFWNVALSADQVRQIMVRRLSGSESNLVAVYHFDEVTGTSAVDGSHKGG